MNGVEKSEAEDGGDSTNGTMIHTIQDYKYFPIHWPLFNTVHCACATFIDFVAGHSYNKAIDNCLEAPKKINKDLLLAKLRSFGMLSWSLGLPKIATAAQ